MGKSGLENCSRCDLRTHDAHRRLNLKICQKHTRSYFLLSSARAEKHLLLFLSLAHSRFKTRTLGGGLSDNQLYANFGEGMKEIVYMVCSLKMRQIVLMYVRAKSMERALCFRLLRKSGKEITGAIFCTTQFLHLLATPKNTVQKSIKTLNGLL